MTILTIDLRLSKAQDIEITEDELIVALEDGRTITTPLAWYPRLAFGSENERNKWRLIGDGEGIHWEDLDEDISVEHLLAGIPSNESQKSLQRWLTNRTRI